jgi:hypothetical protein
MIKRYCDECGKEITEYYINNIFLRGMERKCDLHLGCIDAFINKIYRGG